MGGQEHVELVGGQQVDCRPAGQRHTEGQDTGHQQGDSSGNRVNLHQAFRVPVEIQARVGTESKVCHVSSLLHVDSAEHGVVANTAVFVTDHAVLTGDVGGNIQHHFIARNDLHVDVDRLQGETVLPVHGR